jgi:hypothetical protein
MNVIPETCRVHSIQYLPLYHYHGVPICPQGYHPLSSHWFGTDMVY